ncbi:UNVERIFIED_CONTAM: hypothetical protein Sradi_6426300 [Sesamum radiatum]|uniref:Reverse transcriptase domain-containing protein n=1 Tax=Sesamum radiatum TaxID=300843 RepID=A0AAW2K6U3_SESRA
MAEEDRVKTSFITKSGIYCYNVMPFDLKNTGATYQRLVNKMFEDQIGTSMQVYADDMLVKSKKESDHLAHLKQAFEVMRAYGMKLNPTKCMLEVRGGRFLGYMVSERGIETNPKNIKVIMQLKSPRTRKDVQNLTGREHDVPRGECEEFLGELLGREASNKHYIAPKRILARLVDHNRTAVGYLSIGNQFVTLYLYRLVVTYLQLHSSLLQKL